MSRAQPGQCRSQAQLSLVQNVPDRPFLDSDWWTLTKYSEETPHITAPSFFFTAAVQTDLQHTAECQLYRDYLQLRKLHSKVPACSIAALQHASHSSRYISNETTDDNSTKSPTLLFKFIFSNKVDS